MQALTYPRPRVSYRLENRIRRKFGLDVTPVSVNSLWKAVRRLSKGEIVLTAADRPDKSGEELIFFGRKVYFPIGHARLALRTKSQIMVVVCKSNGPGHYKGVSSPVIEPESTGDEYHDAVNLAQRVLAELENYISSRPDEWLMFWPVWSNK